MRSRAASVVRASAMPWPSTAASMTMLARLSTGPCESSAPRDPGRLQPLRPVLAVVEMQQRKFQHVRRLGEPIAPGEQLGAADREQLLGAQARDIEAGPVAVAVAHGEIDVLAREVDVMQRRRDPQIDARDAPRRSGRGG